MELAKICDRLHFDQAAPGTAGTNSAEYGEDPKSTSGMPARRDCAGTFLYGQVSETSFLLSPPCGGKLPQ